MIVGAAGAIMADDSTSDVSRTARAGAPFARLAALLALGLTLGACTKCYIPTPWEHSSAGATPAVCHSEPAPQ
jgi:hypothetical protein